MQKLTEFTIQKTFDKRMYFFFFLAERKVDLEGIRYNVIQETVGNTEIDKIFFKYY